MSPPTEPQPLKQSEFQRSWTLITIAGLLGTTYFTCIASAPRTKFLVELGATPFDFGLIASLTSITIAFQILSALWTNRVRRRKPLWIAMYLVNRLLFLLVLVAPTAFAGERTRMWWIIGVLAVNGALANLGNPMWFSWMSDLVPRDSLNVHWAVRQRLIAAGSVLGKLGVALVFNHFERSDRVVEGFITLGVAGVVLGVIDILLFLAVPEPENERTQELGLRATLIEPLRNAQFRPYLLFRAYWVFAIATSAPFMGPYLISEMKLSTLTVQLTFISMSIGVVLASRMWGMLCDNYGHRPALQMVAAAKPMVPLAYVLIPPIAVIAVPLFAVMALVDGMVNAGGQIATRGVMLKDTPRRNRAMYIGTTNFVAMGVAGGLAPFIAGAVIEPLTNAFAFDAGVYHFTGYHLIFLLSFFLRAGAFPLARRLREPESVSARKVIAYLRRTDALRAMQAINRLRDADDVKQRVRAARQLGLMRSPLGAKELTRALEDPSERVRTVAADALGRIQSQEAVAPLAQALADHDTGVQHRAARALGQIGGDEAARALKAALPALHHHARTEAMKVLTRLQSNAGEAVEPTERAGDG